MKFSYLRTLPAALLLLAGTTAVLAQDVVIVPEQEVVIREYVKKKPLVSIDLPGVELNLGSTLPETVELHAIEVPDVQYRYVMIGGRAYLVEPSTRKIVYVIE